MAVFFICRKVCLLPFNFFLIPLTSVYLRDMITLINKTTEVIIMIYERSSLIKTSKVRIKSSSDYKAWYADHIGSTFTVTNFSSTHYKLDGYSMASGSPYLILRSDVELVMWDNK